MNQPGFSQVRIVDCMLKNPIIYFFSALAVTLGTLFLPAHKGITLELSQSFYEGKGYPFVFYMPGGSDYGLSFYYLSFAANFAIYLAVILFAAFLIKKFSRKVGV